MMAVFCDRFSLVLFISIISVFLSSISALSVSGSTNHQTKLVLGSFSKFLESFFFFIDDNLFILLISGDGGGRDGLSSDPV